MGNHPQIWQGGRMTKAAASPRNYRYKFAIVLAAYSLNSHNGHSHQAMPRSPGFCLKKEKKSPYEGSGVQEILSTLFPLGTYSHQTIHLLLTSSTAHPGKIPDTWRQRCFKTWCFLIRSAETASTSLTWYWIQIFNSIQHAYTNSEPPPHYCTFKGRFDLTKYYIA